MSSLELWGGVECTVNRVGDAFHDQVRRSGHHDRPDDIARFAALGIRALRVPILWERVAPDGLSDPDWRWSDDRLARVHAHGIRPIATLLHHGSGPRATNLLDPGFPAAFETFASAVAERYPSIADFTPVNEPLTTARFSALYGHWYPHQRDDRAFVRALLNQILAIVGGMQRIRAVTPAARLVITEDAGRVASAPALAYQAEFENHRRWLTFDFLCGCVDRSHPLWRWLIANGARAGELSWIREQHHRSVILGLNYYLTSDRFLDERLWLYPGAAAGGNGRHRYVDTEAVRVGSRPPPSYAPAIEDTWSRYRRPIALTEVHAGCTREEQLRWFARAWGDAERARDAGVDVRAVTAWSLLGSFDWNSLVTRSDEVYEPGGFDVRSQPPRRTALGSLAMALAARAPHDPLADQPGWWERPAAGASAPAIVSRRLARVDGSPAPILIVGAGGVLGSALADACAARGLHAVAVDRRALDVTDTAAIARALLRVGPWAVVNAAGMSAVDEAEVDRESCWRRNTHAATALAAAASAFRARFVSFSTDLVFDGSKRDPYVESDRPRPLNQFGLMKAEAEAGILRHCPEALIVRTAACFGAGDPRGFLTQALRELAAGREVGAAGDLVVSPTFVPHLVSHTLDLLIDGDCGIWHLANRGSCSWAELVAAAARLAGLDAALVRAIPSSRLDLKAARPAFSALASERGQIMPPLEQGLLEYCAAAADGLWVGGEPLRRTRPGQS